MSEHGGYEHVNWPDLKLADRFLELQELLEFTQHEERRLQISHELAGCAFELLSRKRDRGEL